MACSSVQKPVFVDTNLGTHIAVPVSPGITAKEFKKELEMMHLHCFPEVGSIRVKGLLVKKKSRYYHLSESLPLKCAFQGSNATWFLQIEAHKQTITNEIKSCGAGVFNGNSADDVTDSMKFKSFSASVDPNRIKEKRKRKKKGIKSECKIGCQGQALSQCALIDEEQTCNIATRSEISLEPVSVSGIIKKYFSDYDEVASSPVFPYMAVRNKPKEHPSSRNVKPTSEVSREKHKKLEVGKRLLRASDNLGVSPSHLRPVLSLCKLRNGRSLIYKSSATARSLVFDITDEGA